MKTTGKTGSDSSKKTTTTAKSTESSKTGSMSTKPMDKKDEKKPGDKRSL